jgi:hypothetical protein
VKLFTYLSLAARVKCVDLYLYSRMVCCVGKQRAMLPSRAPYHLCIVCCVGKQRAMLPLRAPYHLCIVCCVGKQRDMLPLRAPYHLCIVCCGMKCLYLFRNTFNFRLTKTDKLSRVSNYLGRMRKGCLALESDVNFSASDFYNFAQ